MVTFCWGILNFFKLYLVLASKFNPLNHPSEYKKGLMRKKWWWQIPLPASVYVNIFSKIYLPSSENSSIRTIFVLTMFNTLIIYLQKKLKSNVPTSSKCSTLEGSTKFHQAAKRGDIDHCKALIQEGFDINARDKAGFNPFMDSVRSGNKFQHFGLKIWKLKIGTIIPRFTVLLGGKQRCAVNWGQR